MRNDAVRNIAPGPVGMPGLVGQNPDVAVAILDHYVLLLWRLRVVPQGLAWVRSAFGRARTQNPNRKIVFLTAVVPGCNVSTPPEVRRGIADLLTSHEDDISCAGIVFEGQGFHMTVVRSIITAINLASRSRFPNSVFSGIDPALDWVCEKDEASNALETPRRVKSAIDRLRVI